jgi:hypothetical protein
MSNNHKNFEKALLNDRQDLELSHFDDNGQTIDHTFKIPSDQDVEKRATSTIERLFIEDIKKQNNL